MRRTCLQRPWTRFLLLAHLVLWVCAAILADDVADAVDGERTDAKTSAATAVAITAMAAARRPRAAMVWNV